MFKVSMFGAAEQEGGKAGERERQFWKEESRGKRLRAKQSVGLQSRSFRRGRKSLNFVKFILEGRLKELGQFL